MSGARQEPGPAVDAHGAPVVDPTANVIALVKADSRRQDDLRRAEWERERDLRRAFEASINELLRVREEHAKERERSALERARLESARLDALRLVDVTAVSRAASDTIETAKALATSVNDLAKQNAATLERTLSPLIQSLHDVQRAQYEQQGQRVAQTETKGSNQWLVGAAIAVMGLLISAAGLALTLVVVFVLR